MLADGSWSGCVIRTTVTELANHVRLLPIDGHRRVAPYHDGMSEPVLRVETADGVRCDDPPSERLFELLDGLCPGNQYLILDRIGAPNDEYYMQVYREDDSFVIEYRDGGADRHYETYTDDVRIAHRVLAGWALDDAGWRNVLTFLPWIGSPKA